MAPCEFQARVGVFDKWSGQEAPISRSFPPGARAVMASSGGERFVRAADGQACVEFLAPDYIEARVTELGQAIAAGGRHAALTGGKRLQEAKDHSTRRRCFMGSAFGSKHRSVPMSNSVDSFVLWPVGIAFGGWLFFEIARRM